MAAPAVREASAGRISYFVERLLRALEEIGS
jgi:hypothetical protein